MIERIRRLMDAVRLVESLHSQRAEEYTWRHLNKKPRYLEPKRLNRFEYQVYSQNGEDGILSEIFRRVGTTNKYFVEFGVENGIQSDTTRLLLKG